MNRLRDFVNSTVDSSLLAPLQCFSAVVGPNGSGKSNVIDAMLFVFGKRAKQIRQDKLSDLIHKSENHQDLDMCAVTVFFQQIIDLVY